MTEQEQEARRQRITRRLAIMKTLSSPLHFRLVEMALEANEPIVVDLDFTLNQFPGLYIRNITEALTELQQLGIVAVSGKTGTQDVTFTKGSIWLELKDDVAIELIELIYR